MRKTTFVILIVLATMFVIEAPVVQSQTGRGGYGMGPGMMGGGVNIPAKLAAPKNTEWIQKLREILTLEKESLAQYQADQELFNAFMPYMMVIPQEEDHVTWIGQLFGAYGLPEDGKVPPVVVNKTLTEAYQLSVKLENDLLPRYEWLTKNAEDRDTAEVLNVILMQSRWHLVMFEHVLRMGHGYGYNRGFGMMGRYGMMGGYGGYGMGPGYYRGRSTPSGKPIDAKEAEAMMKDYLKATRNPNLKLGEIKDAGNAFEAEIRTQDNALVDRILINKTTGSVRSAY